MRGLSQKEQQLKNKYRDNPPQAEKEKYFIDRSYTAVGYGSPSMERKTDVRTLYLLLSSADSHPPSEPATYASI